MITVAWHYEHTKTTTTTTTTTLWTVHFKMANFMWCFYHSKKLIAGGKKTTKDTENILKLHIWGIIFNLQVTYIVIQFSRSVVSNSLQPHGRQASLSIANSWSLPKLMSIESVMPSNYLMLCCPLLLPSIFPNIRVFSNESALCIRWPKYWSFSFNISPSNEHLGLISFRMDWLDLCSPRDSQESSPTPQLKSINSSVLSLFYSPTLTSIHDYWKNHILD